MPKRVETIVVDLTTARDSGNPLEIKVPFNAVHVESIYTTSSGSATTGTVKISFDYGDIASINNAKTLSSNDSFTVDKEVSKAFVTNTAQSGVSARISFMTDIDYRPGATQSVVTSGNVTALSVPKKPALTINRSGNGATYTVPAGYWGLLNGNCEGRNNAGNSDIQINGALACTAYAPAVGANVTNQLNDYGVVAGDVILITTSNAADGSFNVRLWPDN